MWRNREVVRFLRWLRAENADRSADRRVGFYGLDLYSLHRSMACVIEYLDKVDPAAAARARHGYACFDVFGDDAQRYGYAATLDLERSCEDEVVEQLVELRRRAAEYASRDGRIAADEYFVAEQNARVVCDAEAYYRAMFRGGAESWNLRDRHMLTTLEAVLNHAARTGSAARAVVWAHNSHLGDARAREGGAGPITKSPLDSLRSLGRQDQISNHRWPAVSGRARCEAYSRRPSRQRSRARSSRPCGVRPPTTPHRSE